MKYYIIIFCVLLLQSFTNPSSSDIKAGDVSIHSSEKTMSIIQKSDTAIINWKDFSIKENEITKITQPSSKSSILNRVTGDKTSFIDGRLESNGSIYLINPKGLVIGPNGVINANKFFATTLEMMDDEFLSGKNITISGSSLCKIINNGTIKTFGGEVYLIAKEIESYGTIDANGNPINIIGANEILLIKEKNSNVAIKPKAKKIKNYNRYFKNSNIYECAMNLEENDKKIINNEDTKVMIAGTLKSNDSKVHILAEDINIYNAVIDVSGIKEKEVLIGGGFQGKNSDYVNAKNVFMSENAVINASGKDTGNGGNVVVFSDQITSFYGKIYSQGGKISGDGGFVEVSGKKFLNYKGKVFTISENGAKGNLLLDPYNITISTDTTANGSFDSEDPNVFSPSDSGCILNNTDLTDALALSDVIVQTDNGAGSEQGNIIVDANISWAEQTTLSLLAENKVIINEGVTISNTNEVATNFDGIEIIASGGATSANYVGLENRGTITSYYGNISLQGQGGDTSSGNYGIYNNVGNISSTGTGTNAATITLVGTAGAGVNRNCGIYNNDSSITSIDGNITLTGTGNGTGENNFGIFNSDNTTCSSTGTGSHASDITMTGIGGDGTNGNHGIFNAINSSITVDEGVIELTGTGQGSGYDNCGIYNYGSSISSTGTAVTTKAITLEGTASIGTNKNRGIYNFNSTITSDEGNISLTGTGKGSGKSNSGIYNKNSSITSIGTGATAGNISLDGTGGEGTDFNSGIYNNSSVISSIDGHMNFSGNGKGSGISNYGLSNSNGAIISSTGDGVTAAKITINSTAGEGSENNCGMFNQSSTITSINGNILVLSHGKGPVRAHGVFNFDYSTISSTGEDLNAASIHITGYKGGGNKNFGVYNKASAITSITGLILLGGDDVENEPD
ncbi:MAG: filamentous hemagglutinin N-terminal domain-containing protein [Bacteroidales bacterium]|nr:filamentous hemagglutinin N-terminal domain-containing protein [Bacteroidales bacterium]